MNHLEQANEALSVHTYPLTLESQTGSDHRIRVHHHEKQSKHPSTVHTSPFTSESGTGIDFKTREHHHVENVGEMSTAVSTVEPGTAEKSTQTSLHDTGTSTTVQLRLYPQRSEECWNRSLHDLRNVDCQAPTTSLPSTYLPPGLAVALAGLPGQVPLGVVRNGVDPVHTNTRRVHHLPRVPSVIESPPHHGEEPFDERSARMSWSPRQLRHSPAG